MSAPSLLRTFAVGLAVLTLGAMAYEVSRVPERPVLGMSERGNRVGLVREGGPAWRAGLRDGDRILEIAGRDVDRLGDPSAFLRHQGLTPTELIVERGGVRLSAEIRPELPPGREVAWQLAHAATAAAIVVIGIWVLMQRLQATTWVFFCICFAFGVLLFRPYVPPTTEGRTISVFTIAFLSSVLPGLLLHFFLLFPFERRAVREQRWILLLVYAPVLVLLPFLEGSPVAPERLGLTRAGIRYFAGQVTVAYWILSLVLSLAFFLRSYRTSPLPIVRKKIRVTLYGALLGLLPLLGVILVRMVRPDLPLPGDRFATLMLLFLPASIGYAILRYGIFDTELLVRKGFVYSALTSVFILGYFLVFFGLRAVLSGAAGFEGRIGTAFALGFVVLLLSPLRTGLQDRIDRWVYPDRFDTRRPLRETALRLREAQGESGVERAILQAVDSALRVESAAIFRPTPEGFRGRDTVGADRDARSLLLSRHLTEPLFRISRPITRADLEDELPYGYLPPGDLEALHLLSARAFLPLSSKGEPLALVVLGPRAYGERFTPPDLDILEGFQSQAALALRNAQLEEEQRGHAHLAEEMEVARSLQQQLLPTSLPRLPRVALAATNRPCFAVGGDYYDCVSGTNGSLALAIGDVTGHGVPAALLMANVQATFRAEMQAGRDPAQVLGSLNRQLCAIDRPERFVTFFAALFDPGARRLVYANGGHERPILVRGDGGIERLDRGGLLLGIEPKAEYDLGEADLQPGDLLFLYTDGVVEPGGPDARFAEADLVDFVSRNRHLAPLDLIGRVLEQVDAPVSEAHADDATLLLLKLL